MGEELGSAGGSICVIIVFVLDNCTAVQSQRQWRDTRRVLHVCKVSILSSALCDTKREKRQF